MYATLVSGLMSGLSAAVLSIIARLVTKEVLENIIETIVRRGLTYIASQTENTVDDEIARFINEKLRNPTNPQKPDA